LVELSLVVELNLGTASDRRATAGGGTADALGSAAEAGLLPCPTRRSAETAVVLAVGSVLAAWSVLAFGVPSAASEVLVGAAPSPFGVGPTLTSEAVVRFWLWAKASGRGVCRTGSIGLAVSHHLKESVLVVTDVPASLVSAEVSFWHVLASDAVSVTAPPLFPDRPPPLRIVGPAVVGWSKAQSPLDSRRSIKLIKLELLR